MTAHSGTNKPSKNPFVVAMALGAGLFLLLQLLANRLLLRQEKLPPSVSSSLMIPALQQRYQVVDPKQQQAVDMPVDLFNDEFFSSPFMIDSGLLSLKQDMDRQMQELLGDSPLLRGQESLWKGYDIQEDDAKVTVSVTVPKGITQDDIRIEVIGGTVMHISGGRADKQKDGTKSQVQFEKRFALGRNMQQSKIEANLKGGVLTVTTPKAAKLPKKEEVRKIPIKVEL